MKLSTLVATMRYFETDHDVYFSRSWQQLLPTERQIIMDRYLNDVNYCDLALDYGLAGPTMAKQVVDRIIKRLAALLCQEALDRASENNLPYWVDRIRFGTNRSAVLYRRY